MTRYPLHLTQPYCICNGPRKYHWKPLHTNHYYSWLGIPDDYIYMGTTCVDCGLSVRRETISPTPTFKKDTTMPICPLCNEEMTFDSQTLTHRIWHCKPCNATQSLEIRQVKITDPSTNPTVSNCTVKSGSEGVVIRNSASAVPTVMEVFDEIEPIEIKYIPDNLRIIPRGSVVTKNNVPIGVTMTDNPFLDQPEVDTTKPKSETLSPGVDQVPFEGIEAIGAIFAEGEKKYGRDNWKKQPNNPEYNAERTRHAIRHLMLWANGDRSEPHLAKVAWFCVTTIWREKHST